ncbi:nuclear valosin-containing protein-like, partial [Trichonephila clavata]
PKENDADKTRTPFKTGRRFKSEAFTPKQSTLNFDNVGGMDDLLMRVLKMFFHYKVPSLLQKLGLNPVRGILLHGPPGCGKTHLARAIAGELEIPIIEVAATELVCGISGESESKIRDIFDSAVRVPGKCILFIDEIDAICPKRETTDNPMLRRMVAQMIKCLDELFVKDPEANVMVIGATNTPDMIDPALRRGRRFDRELAVGIPNEEARLQILKVVCKDIKLSSCFDLHWLAHNTPGYVGADLLTLASTAMENGCDRIFRHLIESDSSKPSLPNTDGEVCQISQSAEKSYQVLQPAEKSYQVSQSAEENTCSQKLQVVENIVDAHKFQLSKYDETQKSLSLQKVRAWFKSASVPEEELDKYCFTMEDFQDSLQECIPYSKREGFASVPNTTWEDIGALEDIKEELRSTIMWPVQYRQFYEENKLSSTKGILLYGPKGCGKTLLAKAIANECSINFLSVNGPELLSMYVGESEKAVRKCFERARNSAPCVIFFDEFDALCPPRSSAKENAPVERVVNQLLTETCGMQERKQVFLVAATNRLEKIDSAMLRPGRLEKILYVGLPSPSGRAEILKSLTKNKTCPKIEEELELETIAFDSRCENFSGADLAYLVREATTKAIKERISSSLPLDSLVLSIRHFDEALKVVKPSFSERDRKYFQRTSSHFSTG